MKHHVTKIVAVEIFTHAWIVHMACDKKMLLKNLTNFTGYNYYGSVVHVYSNRTHY